MRQTQTYSPRRRSRKRYSDPHETYFILAIAFTILLIFCFLYLKFSIYLAYIAGLNIVTFCFYGFDKLQAKRDGGRVPEKILHFLAIMGGAVGGIAGQWIFHHKIRKRIFHIILWTSLLVHSIIFIIFNHILLTSSFNDLMFFAKSLIDNLNKTFNRH